MKKNVLTTLLVTAISMSMLPVPAMAEAFAAEEAVIAVDESENAEAAEEESEDENAAAKVDLKQVSAGGSTYAFADLTGVEDREATEYLLTVNGRGGTTVTTYAFSDLKQLPGTDYYYIVTAGKDLVGQAVYAYTGETAASQSYTELYRLLGVDADAADYDVVASATHFTSFHAKDISGTVNYGADDEGNKVITGISTGRSVEALDGTEYMTALMLSADEKELSETQAQLAQKNLKQNPTSAGTGAAKSVALASASYVESRYGIGEFAIVPDDSVDGYVWSEYWDNVYGATVSDGSAVAGAVHWIDLYGEIATSGGHYNKIELALNSGTALASNEADVHRYDAFIEDGQLKPGKYTVTIYADGYEDLTATVINAGESTITLKNKTVTYNGKAVKMSAKVTGSTGAVTYTYYSDKACTKALSGAPKNAGTYYVVASVAEDEIYNGATSEAAKLVINKKAATIKTKTLSKSYTVATVKKAAKSYSMGASVDSKGTLTYSKTSGSKKITVTKSGKIKIAKNTKKGTYKAKIKIKAASTKNYKSASKTVTVKVVVK